MRKGLQYIVLLVLILLGTKINLVAQISPYALSPKWYFGNKAGLDFTSGTAAFLPGGLTNSLMTIEGSSTICDPSGAVVFYSDGYSLYDGSNTFIQNTRGGTSSTQNSVCVPDPANPSAMFYLFTANVDDNGGGDKPATANLGIHYYHIQKSGTTITVLSGPIKVANHDEVTEQICAGTDGSGNYWVIAHEGANKTGWMDWNFRSWQITSSGVNAAVLSTVAGISGNNPWQGSMKINQCQNRLVNALSVGVIEVFDWNNATGKVTGLIRRVSGLPSLYGCEFSPDGNIVYFSTINGNMLYQLDIASGAVYSDPLWTSSNNTAEVGTMQLGPDNRIYVTNVSIWGTPCYIGVINNPNVVGAGCNYNKTGFLLNAGPATYPNINRGIANIAWTFPNYPSINYSGCSTVNFNYNFNTYFNNPIAVLANSEEWDFGDGGGYQSGLGATPTHTYATAGSYTVKIRLHDQVCNKTWTSTRTITADCSLPLDFLFLEAEKAGQTKVKIVWATTAEVHADYFVILKSTDGINFKEIGIVGAKGSSTQITGYEFMDNEASNGIVYYQILQVDKATSTIKGFNQPEQSKSQIVSVNGNEFDLLILPNPSADEFKIITASKDKPSVIVYDVLGQEILNIGNINSELKFGNSLTPGTYIVKIVFPNEVIIKKVEKE
jgi:PKD repeat protein